MPRWRLAGTVLIWRRILLLATVLLTMLAVADLEITHEQPLFRYLAVVDITQSMNVSDAGVAQERRLDFAVQALRAMLTGLPCGSELGLALFAANRSFLLLTPVDICQHFHELNQVLNWLDWRLAWASYSEVAKGLYSALLATRELAGNARLLFLTDGHEAPPVNPKFRPVFNKGKPGEVDGLIVGIGGDIPQPIPQLDMRGKVTGYWRADDVLQIDVYSLGRNSSTGSTETMVGVDDSNITERIKNGTEHLSSLRESYLRQLASETALDYYRLDSINDWLNRLQDPNLAEWREAPLSTTGLAGLLALLLLSLEAVLAWRRG